MYYNNTVHIMDFVKWLCGAVNWRRGKLYGGEMIFPVEITVYMVDLMPELYGAVSGLSRAHNSALKRNLERYKTALLRFVIEYWFEYTILPNGVKHGKFIERYHGNKIFKIFNYVDGKLQGEFTLYYPNSNKIDRVANYVDNELHGECIDYYESGKICSKAIYNKGKLTGTWTGYYASGIIHHIVEYIDDIQHGKYIVNHESGIKLLENYFEYGKEVYLKCHYKIGFKDADGYFDDDGNDIPGYVICNI